MACYCQHIRCFDCNNYGHVTTDCLTKYLLQACQHSAEITPLVNMTGQYLRTAIPGILTVTMETDTDSANHILSHITPGIGVTTIVIPTEAF